MFESHQSTSTRVRELLTVMRPGTFLPRGGYTISKNRQVLGELHQAAMSRFSHDVPLSSFAYAASIFGLSVASLVGLSKILTCWKNAKVHGRRPRGEVGGEVEKKDGELRSLRESLEADRAGAKAIGEELALLRQEVDRMREQLVILGQQLEGTRNENRALVIQAKEKEEEVQLLRGEKEQVKSLYSETLRLLESRTSELRSAKVHFTEDDQLSGAEVIRMLEALNAEILQTAAFVAESFEFEEKALEEDEESEETREACARATEILGSRMVRLLKSSQHHEDPILIQIAFQAGMSAYSHWMISSWYFENPENEQLLTEIYERVRDSGKIVP